MSTRRGGLAWWRRGVMGLVLVGVSMAATVPAGAQAVAPPVAPPTPPVVAPPSFTPLPPSLGEGTGTPLWCYLWSSGPLCSGDLELEDLPDWPGNPFGSQLAPGDGYGDAELAGSGWIKQAEGGPVSYPGAAMPAGLGEAGTGAIVAVEFPPSVGEDWVTVSYLIGSSGTQLEWQLRRTVNGIEADWAKCEGRYTLNGVSRVSRSTGDVGGNPSTGTIVCGLSFNANQRSSSQFTSGLQVYGLGTGSVVSSTYYDDGWSDSWDDEFATLPGSAPWFSGSLFEVPYSVLATGLWRNSGGTSIPAGEALGALMEALLAGVAPPVEVPYDPQLPEIDPNEVPELAPAVPVPWPDGWPDPDLDDPPASPSTSTIPDPTPQPSLAPEVPGETTDTALATRIMDGFGWLGDRIGGFFDWLVSELWRMVQWLVDRLRELLFQLIVALVEIARWIVQQLAEWIQWAVTELLKGIGRLIEVLVDGFLAVIEWLRQIWLALVDGFGQVVSALGSWMTWLGDLIGQWVTWLSTSLWSMFEWLAATLNGIAVWMIEQLSTITVSVSVAFSVLTDLLLDLFVDIFVPSYTWTDVIPDPGPPPPNPLPPGLGDLSASCGPSFSIPVVDLTFRTPNPSTSGCPGHGPGGSRLPVDDLQGDVWGYRNALRALMAFSLWLSVGFVGLRAMPWSRSRDDASDTFVAAGGGL